MQNITPGCTHERVGIPEPAEEDTSLAGEVEEP